MRHRCGGRVGSTSRLASHDLQEAASLLGLGWNGRKDETRARKPIAKRKDLARQRREHAARDTETAKRALTQEASSEFRLLGAPPLLTSRAEIATALKLSDPMVSA